MVSVEANGYLVIPPQDVRVNTKELMLSNCGVGEGS